MRIPTPPPGVSPPTPANATSWTGCSPPARAWWTLPRLELSLTRQEVEEAMRATTETLSQVTDLLAVVSAPSASTATIRRVEVLAVQPQVVVAVLITSTGEVVEGLRHLRGAG